jgi:hypothetical protein
MEKHHDRREPTLRECFERKWLKEMIGKGEYYLAVPFHSKQTYPHFTGKNLLTSVCPAALCEINRSFKSCRSFTQNSLELKWVKGAKVH